MTQRPLTIRNLEGFRVFYDVLSSKRTYYYTVEMLGETAISCECPAGQYRKFCKHKEKAEQAERVYQNSLCARDVNPVEEKREKAPLNGNRAFSLLKK